MGKLTAHTTATTTPQALTQSNLSRPKLKKLTLVVPMLSSLLSTGMMNNQLILLMIFKQTEFHSTHGITVKLLIFTMEQPRRQTEEFKTGEPLLHTEISPRKSNAFLSEKQVF